MIRFCDREVRCIEYDSLDRSEILSYFLNGHIEESVYIYDSSGKYYGSISYSSLLMNNDVYKAVNTDYAILNEKIWKNGRDYFFHHKSLLGKIELLPILNKEHQLICFAYQDGDANREIRMLRELEECKDAIDFSALYPDYKRVCIYGCNELAYYFAKYLKNRGVAVDVSGEFWNEIGIDCDEGEELDYEKYVVYAEGTAQKKNDLHYNLLRSASVEFECIDKIYEENIKNGLIKDAEGDFDSFIGKMRLEKEIVIIGSDAKSQNAYDLLLENGIDICCFTSENRRWQGHRLFGKQIVSKYEAMLRFRTPVFIDCRSEGSAWGIGSTDKFDYMGYWRNKQFFFLRDYKDIPEKNLINVLEGKNIVLLGDVNLCCRLYKYLNVSLKKLGRIGYWDIFMENEAAIKRLKLSETNQKEIDNKEIFLLVIPELITTGGCFRHKEKEYIGKLKELGIDNYTDYFSNNSAAVNMENTKQKYVKVQFKPKGILIGSINAFSGNIFFRDLLDGHPNLLLMDYGFLNDNLHSLCIRLAEEAASDILSRFWELYESEAGAEQLTADFPDREAFHQKLEELLKIGDTFTSQELFVIIHIAYAKMWGKNIIDIQTMFIYWEPHFFSRDFIETYARWLGSAELRGFTVGVVRNLYVRAGSFLKGQDRIGALSSTSYPILRTVLEYPNEVNKKYEYWEKFVVKFEELKCNPQKELSKICDKIGIPWSDKLLETTRHGKISYYCDITGFDLKPVFNNYEEFFSGFDRMRISLIAAPWQKKYGYPYVSCLDFTLRELQEIFFKKFRFEEKYHLNRSEEKRRIYMNLQRWEREILRKVRRAEILKLEEGVNFL